MLSVLNSKQFSGIFQVIPNRADGNCLFESMYYLIRHSDYMKDAIYMPTHQEIRELVSNFYKDFDREKDYPHDTIEYAIKIGLLYDNDDNGVPHDKNVSNNYAWASMTDLLVCSVIFDVNINLYKKNGKKFYLEKITSQYNFKITVNLLYNGKDHFEALIAK